MAGYALPGLTTRTLGRHFTWLEEVDSTNNWLKARSGDLPHGAAVAAGRQTAGKGRLGRRWEDVPGLGLALSVLLRDRPLADMTLLPLVTGLAVAKALEAACGVRADIKWSNDLVLESRKICGILCESTLTGSGGNVVVGMGINLNHTAADLERLGLVYAGSLGLVTGCRYDPLTVAAAVLEALEQALDAYGAGGFDALRAEYSARCITLGREILVREGAEERTGRALEIAPDGGLVCAFGAALSPGGEGAVGDSPHSPGGEVRTLRAGEVSVRGLYGYV